MDAVLHLTALGRSIAVAVAVTESAAALAGFKRPQARRLGRSMAKRLGELVRAGVAEQPLRLLCAIEANALDVELRWRRLPPPRLEPPQGWSRVRGGARSIVWRARGA